LLFEPAGIQVGEVEELMMRKPGCPIVVLETAAIVQNVPGVNSIFN